MSNKFLLFQIVFFCSILCGLSEVIKFDECDDTDPIGFCEVHEVRINPCKEAPLHKPCELKRGEPASIEVDFGVLKSAETLKIQAFGVLVTDVPFHGKDTNGCLYTKCPLVAGTNQTFDFGLNVERAYPRGKFTTKVKITSDESSTEGCCIKFKVKLT